MEDSISGRDTAQGEGEGFHVSLHLPAEPGQLTVLRKTVFQLPRVSDKLKMDLHVMIEEIFVNICSYGYPEGSGTVDVSFDVQDAVTIVFTDSGKPFDPTKDLPNMAEYDIMHTIGGVGRFLTFQLADDYSYEHVGDKNVLRLVKKLD